MKDTSRSRRSPPPRSVPYKKRKPTAPVSPLRRTRRQYDAFQRQVIPPRSAERVQSLRHDETQPSCATSSEGGHHPPSNTGGNDAISRPPGRASTDGLTRGRPSHASARTDVPDIFLRLAPASAPPTVSAFSDQRKAESPSLGSVSAFLRSIELPGSPNAPPFQTPISLIPSPDARPPSLSTDNTTKITCTNGNGHQVSLVYKGYPFTYDLAALPDDPKGTIALLAITRSDPGAYILVGAHYRRTGRSRAACAVIRSLLDIMGTPSDVERTGSNAPSGTSAETVVSPHSSSLERVGLPTLAFKRTAMRPAMLLLAACELDISRERPDDPESATHTSAAHDLFRAIYGTVNDAIVAEAVNTQPNNALGLEFPGNKTCLSAPVPDPSSDPPLYITCQAETLERVKGLEKELSAAHATQKKLQEKLAASDDRLTRFEDKTYALESRSRETRAQLDVSRDENWNLRQRLADSERRVHELSQFTPSVEHRVWGKIQDLLNNFGGGVRGE